MKNVISVHSLTFSRPRKQQISSN